MMEGKSQQVEVHDLNYENTSTIQKKRNSDNGAKRYETHRFSVNKLGKEKINCFRQILAEVSQDFPGIEGATLFGSLTQGRNTEDSDIDGFVFYDPRQVENTETLKSEFTRIAALNILPSEKVKDISFKPISNEIIVDYMAKLSTYIKNWSDYNNSFEAIPENDPIEYIKALENFGQTPIIEEPGGQTIQALFYLQVGNSLDKYRKVVFDQLETLDPDIAQKAWHHFISQVRSFEEGKNLPYNWDERYYPESLDEAKTLYLTGDTDKQNYKI